jgi:hypothetical protein
MIDTVGIIADTIIAGTIIAGTIKGCSPVE